MFICDNNRHLICLPYSKGNLHKMAESLGLKKHWYHKDHYDIPKLRIDEIKRNCIIVSSRDIYRLINEN